MSDSGGQNSEDFFSRFLDDYFAECDEHLTDIRRDLLSLEDALEESVNQLPPNQEKIDTALLDQLFRSFHTIKGISGMVGLSEAEQLSHAVESVLRDLRQRQTRLTTAGLTILVDATGALEEVIGARRANSAIPSVATVLASLAAVSELRSSPQVGNADRRITGSSLTPVHRPPEGEGTAGVPTWRFEFIPSSVLSARGMNVNSVRAQLEGVGKILKATPLVKLGGGIAFEFIVASRSDESSFIALQESGLTYARAEDQIADSSSVTPGSATGREDFALPVEPSLDLPRPPSSMVRVDLERLNDLMTMTGALIATRVHMENRLKHLRGILPAAEWCSLQEINTRMGMQLRDLRKGVMRVRMVPIGESFERMRFAVRELARENQRKIRLELIGQDIEIDKFLVERMMDPLLHLVRNAVSHGIESAEERVRQGKPPEGRISLRASAVGEAVVIEIEDDGRGIDVEKVAARGREQGLITSDEKIDEAKLFEIIAAPSFSTREQADRASGRGVGMDVVKNTLQELEGSIRLTTAPGRGTRFSIELPLTLAIADVLLALVAGHTFAVPQSMVREIVEVNPASVKVIENGEIILYRGNAVPLLRLAHLFHLEEERAGNFYVLIVGEGNEMAALAVRRVLGQREVVVRAVSDPLARAPGITGATEVGDGSLVLILDVPALLACDGQLSRQGNSHPLPFPRDHRVDILQERKV